MSEPIAATISIGGRLPKRLVGPLCREIAGAGVAIEWGDGLFRPKSAEDLLTACRKEQGASVLWLCDDNANWGRFPALEAFLTERAKLPFDLRSEIEIASRVDVPAIRNDVGGLHEMAKSPLAFLQGEFRPPPVGDIQSHTHDVTNAIVGIPDRCPDADPAAHCSRRIPIVELIEALRLPSFDDQPITLLDLAHVVH